MSFIKVIIQQYNKFNLGIHKLNVAIATAIKLLTGIELITAVEFSNTLWVLAT